MHSELLGNALPHSTLSWLGALIVVLGAYVTGLTAIDKGLELLGITRRPLKPLAGLAIPFGWTTWAFGLIYWNFDVATGMIVLLGTTTILITSVTLVRNCRG